MTTRNVPPDRSPERQSESGFPLKPVYGPGDWSDDYASLGDPGAFPYTRHIRRDGYRSVPWQPSLYSGFGEPADANDRFRFLLAEGNGRVSVAFDLPTQLGLDSDDPAAKHEVGRVGVAIDSLRDFEVLLEGIPLDDVPITMNMNALAPVVIAMLASVARRQGVEARQLRGTISNDILHEVACRGLTIWPLGPSLRLLADTAEFVVTQMPSFFAFNVRAALLHEVGASPTQELGFAFAIVSHYLALLQRRGVDVARAAGQTSLFFATSPKLFEEAAKLRAARRMWAHLLRERYGVTDERSLRLRMTSVACNGSHFTREDPELNLVRSALGVLASALGGVQTMVGTALDEAFEIPSDRAQELALRVQQLIALESDICTTADPLGGSYFIESLTEQLEAGANDVIGRVAGWGGVERALADEHVQNEMRDRAYQLQMDIEAGTRPIIGVNVHRSNAPAPPLQLWEPDPGVRERRIAALREVREGRSDTAAAAALDHLADVARDPDASVMPALIDAVETYATVSEITAALSRAFAAQSSATVRA